MSRGLTFDFEDVVAGCDERVGIDTTAVPTESRRRRLWRVGKAAEMMLDPARGAAGTSSCFAVAQVLPDLADHLAFQPMIRSATRKPPLSKKCGPATSRFGSTSASSSPSSITSS